MVDYSKLTVGDILKAIHATKTALKRGEELMESVGRLGANTPSALAQMAESTLKLHDDLERDLHALEAALKKATSSHDR